MKSLKVNMVMFGRCDWVFERMINEYKKYTNHEIVVSKYPEPHMDIYQFWRPGWPETLRWVRRYSKIERSVCMIHGSPSDVGRIYTPELLKQIKKFQHVLTTSKEQYDFFTQHHSNVSTAYLGIDEKFLLPKESINLNPDSPLRIGFSARLYGDGVKGEKLLVNIIKRLDPRIFEIIISSPSRVILTKMLRQHGIRKQQVKISTDTKTNFYNTDIHLVLSRHEGTPLPLIENMAVGNYVLSTPCGVAPEFLNCADICKTANDFIIRINEIYNNRALLTLAHENNPKRVEHLTWEQHAKKVEEIWKSLI
jgi:glycosyltransferase involved in cell wall biosynthesis